MPSSAGSKHTRRSSAARRRRSASGSGCIRSRRRRMRRRKADGVSRCARSSAATSKRVSDSAGSVSATSSSERARPTQMEPAESASSVAVNEPVRREASATSRPAVASWITRAVASSATNARVANSRSAGDECIRHPFDLGRERARRLDAAELLRLCRPDHAIEFGDLLQLGIERRSRCGRRLGGHGSIQAPPTDIGSDGNSWSGPKTPWTSQDRWRLGRTSGWRRREIEGREIEGREIEGREIEGREIEGREIEVADPAGVASATEVGVPNAGPTTAVCPPARPQVPHPPARTTRRRRT